MKRRNLFVWISSVLVIGCAAPAPSPIDQAKRQQIQMSTPTCSSDKECQVKWETAQLWVVRNAGYKIQTATSVLIQTFGAIRSRPGLAAQVTKEPQGDGKYRFIARVWCDNILGCRPDELDAVLDFNRTLNAVQP